MDPLISVLPATAYAYVGTVQRRAFACCCVKEVVTLKRLYLLAVGVAAVCAAALAGVAFAAPPQPVTMTLDETFPAAAPAYGVFSAVGGVFGLGVAGTTGEVPGSFAIHVPVASLQAEIHSSRQSETLPYQAKDLITTSTGSFQVKYEGTFRVVSVDFDSGIAQMSLTGNWQVSGVSGAWSALQGTGTYEETNYESIVDGSGTGVVTLTGGLH